MENKDSYISIVHKGRVQNKSGKYPTENFENFSHFLAPSGAQGVSLSVRPSGTSLSIAQNFHLSPIGLSQVSLR